MTRTRKKPAAAKVATPAEDQAAEVAAEDGQEETQADRQEAAPGIPEYLPDSAPSADMTATAADTPLPSTAPAADLAAAAEGIHDRGIARIEGAETEQADADAELAAVLKRHAAERAQAEAGHRQRSADAARDKSAGEHDILRSGWLANASQERAKAEVYDATETALETERPILLKQVAGVDATLAVRRQEHQDTEAALAAAQQADNAAGAKNHQADLTAAAGIISAQERTRETAQRRLTEIAQLLTEARNRANDAHGTVARMLRDVWPDSEEAARWRQDQELQQAVDALLSYGRGEPQQPQRQIAARSGR